MLKHCLAKCHKHITHLSKNFPMSVCCLGRLCQKAFKIRYCDQMDLIILLRYWWNILDTFLLSTMIVLSGWGYQSLLFCHHSNFCLMENMRISQRLIALSNVCLFKWDQNINHARQVIKAWWSQIYVGNVQFFVC